MQQKIGSTLPSGIYKISDPNNILESLLPSGVKVKVTIDAIRLKSSLKINQILIFIRKSFV